MKVSLIIPMYNESLIVSDAVKTFSEYMVSSFEDFELIFVDDGSTDDCGAAVLAAHEKDARIRLVSYQPNRGKGYAVRAGVAAAEGDLIAFTDCDNAYGEQAVGRLFATLEESGADIVVGSRNLTKDGYAGYTFIRKLASKTYLKLIGVMAGFKLSDSQCGIKGFRRDAAKKIFRNCEVDRFAFDLEVLMIGKKLGCTVAEMPVRIINHRESTVNLVKDAMRMMHDVREMKKRIKHKEMV
ncbi:MAG: glycosyltransferase [Clostridia bacterium]|nr:glycosyltransferase [Clostridia bacterium]